MFKVTSEFLIDIPGFLTIKFLLKRVEINQP